MKTAPGNQRGFTLTEMLVVGTISVIITSVLITFITVYNRSIDEGTAHAHIQMASDVVHEQIGTDIRSADIVLEPGRNWTSNPNFTRTSSSEIILYNGNGMIFSAYKIVDNSLYELHNGTPTASLDADDYEAMKVGTDAAVTVAGDGGFSLSPKRDEVTIDLEISVTYKQTTYTTPSKGEVYRCRN